MINVSLIGRLGNNMIQYSIARLLAERLNCGVQTVDVGINSACEMFNTFPRLQHSGDLKTLGNPISIGYGNPLGYIQYLDFDNLINHKGDIHLSGFFQKHELLFDNQNSIRQYFRYDDSNLKSAVDYQAVVHIRLGDYVGLNHFIHPNYFYKICKDRGLDKVLIVTDEPTSGLLDIFKQNMQCNIERNSSIQDLHYMITAKKLIISQSTFSWWGAFLGNQEEVLVPYITNQQYPWSLSPGIDDIDLIPTTSKYVKVVL